MRVKAHGLNEFIDMTGRIQTKHSLLAVALNVHAQVVFYRLSWSSLVSFFQS